MSGNTDYLFSLQKKSVIIACIYYKRAIVSYILLLLLLFAECSSPNSGSETINERTAVVYMPDGITRAVNALVSISLSAKDSTFFTGTTDGNGVYEIPKLSDNMYSISIEKKLSDSITLVSFQDSAYISSDVQTVRNDTLRYPCEFSGFIKLQPFDQYRKNYVRISVQVLGTSKFTNVDSAGKFTIRNLAKGIVYNLKIETGIQGYSDYYPEIGPSYQSAFSDTFELPYSGIPPVTISELSYQSLTGTVNLTWNPSKVDNLLGYRVYRYNFTKVDSSVVPVVFTKDTMISDTLFSAAADNLHYPDTDLSIYQIAYRISAVTKRYEESVFYLDPGDMIQARSPLVNKMTTEWVLHDSITKQKLITATINRTVGISITGSNLLLPVDSVEYVNISNDSVITSEKSTAPVYNYNRVIYMKWNSPGRKKILIKYADSAGLSCSYNFDTISVDITDYNLSMERLLTIPEKPIASKQFSARLVVRNVGTTALVNTIIPVTLKIDSTLQVRKSMLVRELKPGDTISISIDSSEIKAQLPGIHKLTAIADDSNTISESDESDNVKTIAVEYADVDLSVGEIFFDSSVIMEGDRVACGAYILNNGSTDYKTTFNARVDFCIDGNFFCWGYLLSDIKARDSVKISGLNNLQSYAYWYATKGRHSITVILDSTMAVNESDETNNRKYDTVSVSDFNLKITDFRTSFDTVNQFDVELKSSIIIQGDWMASLNNSIPLHIIFTCNDTAIHSFDTILRNYNNNDTIDIFTKVAGYGFIDSSAGNYRFDMIVDPDRRIYETCYTDNYEPCFLKKSGITFNGYMEDGINGLVDGWNTKEDSTGAIFKWEPVGTGVNGSRCISIECSTFNHATWCFVTKMEVEKSYRLTGWVKGENVQIRETSSSIPATLGCRGSVPVKIGEYGTFDWVYFDEIITNETSADSCFLDCNIGLRGSQYYASGKVYFDNLKLQLVEDGN